MSTPALPCIVCAEELENVVFEAGFNQPYGGTAFTSRGHYGSTVFDPMDGSYLEINVCDSCLKGNAKAVRHTLEAPQPPTVVFSHRWHPGLDGVAEWEAENGALTEEELDAARRACD